MNADYPKSAVSIGDLKNAALYFDHLVPVFVVTEFVKEEEWPFFLENILGPLLPPRLFSIDFGDALAEVNQKTFNLFAKMGIRQHSLEPRIKGLSREEYDRVEDDAATSYFEFVQRFSLAEWPLAAEGGPTTAGFPEAGECDEPALLTLSRVSVIDVSKVPWKQIHEVRRDPIARERLRELRLFAYRNYTGKSPSFVEDDLNSRIAAYEATAKEWGLETIGGALSLVVNSKFATSAFAGTLVSALFGQPLTAFIAGTAGATLEVGRIALEVRRRRMGLETLARDHPISYVTYIRKVLQNESAS